MKQFILFCISGVVGFLVDAGSTQLLVVGAGMSFYLARVLAFFPAATATWLFNRHQTFRGVRHYSRFGEWTRYLLAMSGGALVNYTASAIAYYQFDLVRQHPVLGVAIGSIAGLVVNYASSRWWIFRRRGEKSSPGFEKQD